MRVDRKTIWPASLPGPGAMISGAEVGRICGVSLRYGKTIALDDVTLSIPKGRMVGLIGPDGVGKSSLLALLTGAPAHPEREGVCPWRRSRRRAPSRRRLSADRLYAARAGEESLSRSQRAREHRIFGRLFGQSRSERDSRIAALLKATGLDPFPDRLASQLSGGMRQKLGLCCALIHDPDLLILDEPTTGVDPPLATRQFWSLISPYARRARRHERHCRDGLYGRGRAI